MHNPVGFFSFRGSPFVKNQSFLHPNKGFSSINLFIFTCCFPKPSFDGKSWPSTTAKGIPYNGRESKVVKSTHLSTKILNVHVFRCENKVDPTLWADRQRFRFGDVRVVVFLWPEPDFSRDVFTGLVCVELYGFLPSSHRNFPKNFSTEIEKAWICINYLEWNDTLFLRSCLAIGSCYFEKRIIKFKRNFFIL